MIVFYILFVLAQIKGQSEKFMNTTEIIIKYGYIPENFEITTEDGYILNLIRIIPRGKLPQTEVILFLPGLVCSSDNFVVAKELSAPFYFSNLGYEIWLLNTRGDKYSLKHVYLPTNSKAYWNFTYEQKGLYDNKAAILFIQKYLNIKKINLIGYSEVGSQTLSAMILDPKFYEENVASFVGWASATRLDHNKSPLFNFSSQRYLFEFFDAIGMHEFAEYKAFLTELIYIGGKLLPGVMRWVLSFVSDGDPGGYDMDNVINFLSHYPNDGSTKEYEHFVQGVRNKGFYRYSRYNWQPLIPYNISNIAQIPISLFHGTDDLIVDPIDAEWFYNESVKANKNIIFRVYPKLGHMSFCAFNNETRSFIDDTYSAIQKANSK